MSNQTSVETQKSIPESQNANDYLQRAWMYIAENKLIEAEADFSQAIELDNRFADAYYGLGLTKLKLGHPDAAVQAFHQAIDLINAYLINNEPQRGTILRNLASSHINMLEEETHKQL